VALGGGDEQASGLSHGPRYIRPFHGLFLLPPKRFRCWQRRRSTRASGALAALYASLARWRRASALPAQKHGGLDGKS